MNNIFNFEQKKINNKTTFYISIIIILIILLIIGLLLIKKEKSYQDGLIHDEENNYYLIVKKNYLNELKRQNKLLIENIEYDFKIEEIEKRDDIYIVKIIFPIKLKNIADSYKIILGRENIIEYIIRVVKE